MDRSLSSPAPWTRGGPVAFFWPILIKKKLRATDTGFGPIAITVGPQLSEPMGSEVIQITENNVKINRI